MDEALENFEKWERLLWVAESDFKDLDSQTKTVLAENYGSEGSVKDKDNLALTSEGHKQHLIALSVARREFLKCRSARDLYRLRWEHMRTVEASTRKLQ